MSGDERRAGSGAGADADAGAQQHREASADASGRHPAGAEADLLNGALPALDGPIGPIAWVSGGLALLSIALFAGLAIAFGPVVEAIATLDDRGAVARHAPAATTIGQGAMEGAYLRVHAYALEAYCADEALLAPIVAAPAASRIALGRDRLLAWARLRSAWATALGREGLSVADYRALAATRAAATGDAADERGRERADANERHAERLRHLEHLLEDLRGRPQ